MKTILCAHTDLDGLGCWMVLDYFKIPYDEVLMCDYNRFDDEAEFAHVMEFDNVIMTDFSIPNEQVEALLAAGKIVTIIDHHESSATLKEIMHPNFTLIHDQTVCGTTLAYEYYKPTGVREKKILKQFVRLVDTYDLFKKEHELWEDAQNMNRVLWGSLDWGADTQIQKFQWIRDYWTNKFDKYGEWKWSPYEQKKIDSAINKENKQFIESKACLKKHTDDKGNMFGVTVARSKVSIVAMRLLKENQDIKYLAMINTYSGTWDKISLRSRDDKEFNCNSFEECKGHGCAAGGTVDPQFASKLYKGMENLTYKGEEVE